MENSVDYIAQFKLCCSCGACKWVCPEKAISYIETVGGYLLPKIDLAVCSDCGICKSVCPGTGLIPAVSGRLSSDPFTGKALKTYVGKATDETIYSNSQSGGIVSAILIQALKTGMIGGAVTVKMVEGNPPRPIAKLAKSKEEIKQAQKSKYCPVPLLSILDEIEKLDKPVAVVGVGCQIHGLYNLCERFASLKGKLAFTIGLICDRIMTCSAIDYLIKMSSVPWEKSKILHFRDKFCGGYPGNVNVVCSDGVSVSLASSIRHSMKDFFTPARCHICFDKMNVFSDITVGDPWGIDGVDRIGGESIAVIRTDTGSRVFQSALDGGAVAVRKVNYKKVLKGQGIEQKRLDWHGYTNAWGELGYPLPNFYEKVKPFSTLQQKNGIYFRQIRHAFELDQYPSRDVLIASAKKKIFLLKMKRNTRRINKKITFPFRVMKRMLKTILKNNCLGNLLMLVRTKDF